MGKFAQLLSEASLRKVGEHENGTRKATIHHNSEYDEYQVKFHKGGKHQKDADYHTDNKEDAHGTAKHWVNSANEALDDNAAKAHAKAKEQSIKHGAVQHVNRDEDGHHSVSDWYDGDSTVASYEKGRRLDEKVKVFAPGIKASGVTHTGDHASNAYSGPSRMSDEHKDTEYGKSHRDDAAKKIKAHRAASGQPGSRPFRNDKNYHVETESTQVAEAKHKMSDDDHARVAYHTQMASEHKQKADHHYHEGKSYDDAHRKASLYHNGAAAEHEYAVRAYKTGAANKEEYTAHAKSRTALAHAYSQKANT